MTRKQTMRILAVSLCLLLTVLLAIGLPIYQRVRAFVVEDRIHGTFFPVTRALYIYQQEHGKPADSLTALVPDYLATIPSSTLADLPTYRVLPDRQSWELSIHSRALAQPRIYLCRSTQRFTSEEKRRVIIQYHSTWAVFPSDG